MHLQPLASLPAIIRKKGVRQLVKVSRNQACANAIQLQQNALGTLATLCLETVRQLQR